MSIYNKITDTNFGVFFVIKTLLKQKIPKYTGGVLWEQYNQSISNYNAQTYQSIRVKLENSGSINS